MKLHLGGLTILLLLCLFLEQTTARMSEIEEHEFMKGYLTWMKPGLDLDSLTVYNFGYERPIPFPSIVLTPNSSLRLNLQTSGIHSQSRSSIAVVGEKYVGRFEEIMLDVERIHEDTQALPLVTFLRTKHEINLMNLRSHHIHESPSLAPIPATKSSQSFVTQMKCEATSDKTHHVLIGQEIGYKSYKEICSGEPKKVNLAYNYEKWILEVENNSLV